MDAVGELMRFGGHGIRALCIIAWNEDAIRPWVSAMNPIILGNGSAWENLTADLAQSLWKRSRT